MTKIGIVVDSTTVLSTEIIEKYNIKKVSLNVLVGSIEYREIDLSLEQMLDFMDSGKTFKTSQPAPNLFIEAFDELIKEGYNDILVFPLSKNLSGTYQTANLAKNMVNGVNIRVYDTKICSYALENLIYAILPLIDENKTLDIIDEKINTLLSNNEEIFFISDLYNLFRGGRLSRLSLALGTLLRIKPIIMVQEGKLELVKKVRTHNAVMDFFLEKLEKFKNFKEIYVRIVYLQNEDIVKTLIEKIKNLLKCKITITTVIGPVFHAHLGNNGYGVAILAS